MLNKAPLLSTSSDKELQFDISFRFISMLAVPWECNVDTRLFFFPSFAI